MDRGRNRRGSALVWVAITIVAMIAFCSLAVDLGRVQTVKTELQRAADAAARYAAQSLPEGPQTVAARAADAADDNTADGTPVLLNVAEDVEYGRWNSGTRTFMPLTGAARAAADCVRITCRRVAARDTAVPLVFAQVIGKSTCDVHASAIVFFRKGTGGIVGLSGSEFGNNTFIGGYDSRNLQNPKQSDSTGGGGVGSNGTITAGNNSELDGNAVLGPGGKLTGVDASGDEQVLTTPITAPVMPGFEPGVNPNGVAQNFTADGNVTLPGGTYWFTSLTVNGRLQFAEPAVLIINGPVNMRNNSSLEPSSERPPDLHIYQLGANIFGSDPSDNNVKVTAEIDAPLSTLEMKNNFTFAGRMFFRTIDIKNNALIFYDKSLGSANGGLVVVR
jgi:hypothetical protein